MSEKMFKKLSYFYSQWHDNGPVFFKSTEENCYKLNKLSFCIKQFFHYNTQFFNYKRKTKKITLKAPSPPSGIGIWSDFMFLFRGPSQQIHKKI